MTASHPEVSVPLPGKIQAKLGSAGRVLRLVGQRRHFVLATVIASFLCLTYAGCSGFFINPSISSIYITPSAASIAVNGTADLTAHANYSDGSQGTIQGENVGWTSSNTSVATVTSPGGVVTGVSTGTATITASSQGVNGTASVTVSPSNITSLSITTTQGSTNPQYTATLNGTGSNATLQFYAYGNGSSSNDLTQAVTWTTSIPTVATITTGNSSGNGLATGVSLSPPTTNITATIKNTTSGTVVTSNTIVLTVQ